MDKLSTLFRSPWTMAAVLVLAIADLWLIPAEQTLGSIIKVIFLHGALVEVGLIIFLLGGLVGLAYAVWRTERLAQWGAALQKTGVIIWIIYALASMISTKLAWGQWIAWDEPRVRSSAMVLGFVIVCLLFAWWVGSHLFTALANVAVTGVSFYLIKGASLLRHPFDPIGTSSSTSYQLYFGVLVLIVLLLAVQLTVWMRNRIPPYVDVKESCTMTRTFDGFELSILVNGEPLTTYTHNERLYVAAPMGAVYELALTAPPDGARYLFVASVDGLSIMDGQPAGGSGNQHNGYILSGQSTQIPGFRLDDSNVAQFKFGAVDAAYAAKMGHPKNIGVIGCRIYREKPKPPLVLPAVAPLPTQTRSAHDMGTEFGKQAEHKVRRVPFEVGELVHTLVIEYASREALIQSGIVPPSALGDVDPFPGGAGGTGATPPPGWQPR